MRGGGRAIGEADGVGEVGETVVVIDFETTGLSPAQGARATEVAAVRLSDSKVVDRYHSLMNAGVAIPAMIEELTGISNAMIAQAPAAGRVMEELAGFIGETTLVAHNASFDRKFLQAELQRIGRPQRAEMLCSLRVARRVYPDAPNHKLETLIRHARLAKTGRYHRALADAEMTAALWLRMQDELARSFGLVSVPLALLRKIQSAPCHALRACIEAHRRAGA